MSPAIPAPRHTSLAEWLAASQANDRAVTRNAATRAQPEAALRPRPEPGDVPRCRTSTTAQPGPRRRPPATARRARARRTAAPPPSPSTRPRRTGWRRRRDDPDHEADQADERCDAEERAPAVATVLPPFWKRRKSGRQCPSIAAPPASAPRARSPRACRRPQARTPSRRRVRRSGCRMPCRTCARRSSRRCSRCRRAGCPRA